MIKEGNEISSAIAEWISVNGNLSVAIIGFAGGALVGLLGWTALRYKHFRDRD